MMSTRRETPEEDPLTEIRFTALLEDALTRHSPPTYQDTMPLGEAKKWLQEWLRYVDGEWSVRYDDLVQRSAESGGTVDLVRLRSQLKAAMSLLRSGFSGVLTAVTREAAKPEQYGANPHRGYEDYDSSKERSLRSHFSMGGGSRRAPPAAEPGVSIRILVQQLQGACKAADEFLEAAQPRPAEKVPREWGEDKAILELLQGLMHCRAIGDGDLALDHIEVLANSLATHGIEVVDYTAATAKMFTGQPDPDATGTRTTTPALTVHGELKLMGEALAAGGHASPAGPATTGDQHTMDQAKG